LGSITLYLYLYLYRLIKGGEHAARTGVGQRESLLLLIIITLFAAPVPAPVLLVAKYISTHKCRLLMHREMP